VAGYLASLGKVFKPMMALRDNPFVHHENDVDSVWIQAKDRLMTPVKTTPAPTTPDGAGSSAVAVHVTGRRWLSFLR
jgi:hypothetical protein